MKVSLPSLRKFYEENAGYAHAKKYLLLSAEPRLIRGKAFAFS